MRYVLHIGPSKTGSSVLQSSLIRLRDALAADGIYLPTEWTEYDPLNHKGLVWQLRDGEIQQMREAFDRIRSVNAETVILSCEGFYGLSVPQLEKLSAAMNDAQVDCVYYCRRWSDRLPSVWNQGVRMGSVKTFPDYLRHFLLNPSQYPNFNYTKVWENYASIFGRENIHIISYSNLRDKKGDIVEQFLRRVLRWERPYQLSTDDLKENVSATPTDTEIIRALNYIRLKKTGYMNQAIRDRFLSLRSTLDLSALEGFMSDEISTIKMRDAAEVNLPVLQALQTWSDRLFDDAPGAPMFVPKTRTVEYVHPNWALKRGAGAALQELYRALDLQEKIASSPEEEPEDGEGRVQKRPAIPPAKMRQPQQV